MITGSIASYNWHELSDIDLHIMLDFNKIDDNFDLVKKECLTKQESIGTRNIT